MVFSCNFMDVSRSVWLSYVTLRSIRLVLVWMCIVIQWPQTMYPRWMCNLLFQFNLWGFCTEFKNSPRQTNFNRIIFCLHFILCTIFTFFLIAYLRRPIQNVLGIVDDGIKFSVMLLVYWTTIIESYLSRKTQKQFWDIIEKIDQQFCSHRQIYFKVYIIKMAIYFTCLLLYLLNNFQQILPDSDLYYFWVFYTSFHVFYNVRLFYYLFLLEFIKYELTIIDKEVGEILNSIEKCRLQSAKEFLKKFHRNRINWIQKYYAMSFDLCGIVNSVFGWSNVAAVLLPILLVLTDVNMFYWKVLNLFEVNVIGEWFAPIEQKIFQ